MPTNVLGQELRCCCKQPLTGFYRDGHCHTGPGDDGVHTICVQVTDEFLQFSKEQGNDLSTPAALWEFPGLKPGDRWCLCAPRWKEAYEAGKAPPVILEATHSASLEWVDLEQLQAHAISISDS